MSAPERPEADLREVVERELALLGPEVRRNPGAGWLLLFHQGTPSEAG